MKRSQPKRVWTHAEYKRGPCRVCGAGATELAHIWAREADRFLNLTSGESRLPRDAKALYVDPLRVVALCPDHHRAYDAHELDLLPYLTPEEQAQAVLDAGGIENARIRLAPLAYENRIAVR